MAPKTRELDGKVWCPTCETYLPPDQYHRNGEHRVKRLGSIYRWQCKSCERVASKERKYKQRYSITIEQKEDMVRQQENKCACCNNTFRDTSRGHACIDHDHQTGKVRDILCDRCNTALGWVQEDIELCENLIAYIRKHK